MTARTARLDTTCLQHLAGFLVALADARSRQVFQRHIGQPHGLRPVEFTLLVLLRDHPGAAPKQLAQAMNLPAPHLTLVLDRLAARELVERRRSPTDGRALQLWLTPAGLALAEQVHAISLSMEDGLMQALSPGERVMLRELLIKLARSPAAAA